MADDIDPPVTFTVRIPTTLYERLSRAAERHRRSRAAQLLVILEEALEERPATGGTR